ncbi:hypothetical protein MLD38_020927 [Melastoma candidum]|uniref:Uncharacterized protein n=1 Tax=Melastoma candidum TaxID=119954 RepID=A0ACB9QHX1_9MYRT|nr:hypothetical protein MLD38_020927 [Melastoma candidum]
MGSEVEVKKVEAEADGNAAVVPAVDDDAKDKAVEEEHATDKGCSNSDEKLAIVASPQSNFFINIFS